METSDAVLEREMGCTRDEFLDWLPGATRGATIHGEGDARTVTISEGRRVTIGFVTAPARRIGAVSIPLLRVTIRFEGMEPAARDEFLKYFDLHTRRGGG